MFMFYYFFLLIFSTLFQLKLFLKGFIHKVELRIQLYEPHNGVIEVRWKKKINLEQLQLNTICFCHLGIYETQQL